jgi:hypothetical protein
MAKTRTKLENEVAERDRRLADLKRELDAARDLIDAVADRGQLFLSALAKIIFGHSSLAPDRGVRSKPRARDREVDDVPAECSITQLLTIAFSVRRLPKVTPFRRLIA